MNIFEEFVCATGKLIFEEGQPEYLSIFTFGKHLSDLIFQIIVQYILEIHQVNIVVPRMQDREAFVAQILIFKLLDIGFDKFEVRLVCFYWIL